MFKNMREFRHIFLSSKMFKIMVYHLRAFIVKFNTKQNPFSLEEILCDIIQQLGKIPALFQELISVPLWH